MLFPLASARIDSEVRQINRNLYQTFHPLRRHTDPRMSAPPFTPDLEDPAHPSKVTRTWAVALPLPVAAYDFAAPHGFVGPLPLGSRVVVPWQNGLLVGVVMGEGGQSAHNLREVVAVLDDKPWVGAGFIAATLQFAALSRVPVGLILSDLLGVGLGALSHGRYLHRVRAVAGADLSLFGAAFGSAVPTEAWAAASDFIAGPLDAAREQGLLQEEFVLQPRQVTVYRPKDAGTQPLTPRQQHAWQVLQGAGQLPSQSAWAQAAQVSPGVVAGVLARGWAALHDLPAPPPELPTASLPPLQRPDTLPEAAVWRLHGGRDHERYLLLAQRIRRRLEVGRSVLVIAPDAATLRRAWEHLSGVVGSGAGDTQAALFSGALSDVQREETWARIQRGEVRLVIGTGLALTAPLSDLALLVVLEEGSDAYKLLSGSALFIPDMARRMATALATPLAYVGCVPAVESLTPDIAGLVLPPPRIRLHIVDYAAQSHQPELGPLSGVQFRPDKQGYPLSHDLAQVLRQVAERGRQALLLAPRRGYSALIRCPNCEHTPHCRNCDIPLRLHQVTRQLECHQCGYQQGIPERCEVCGEMMWQARGPGTEWIAAEARKLLPATPVYRFDKDQQDDLSALYNAAGSNTSGVVVATQAILSQPALPDLALIGVTLADTWLNVSDFRASERYHRLLRQLTEWHPTRAPLLLVQTFQATHPALESVAQGLDAGVYVQSEYQLRRVLKYPPHGTLAQVVVSAREQARASAAADDVAAALYSAGATSAEVLGPAPSPVARLKGMYPYHVLLRTRDEARLSELLRGLNRSFKARVRVDVVPRGGL